MSAIPTHSATSLHMTKRPLRAVMSIFLGFSSSLATLFFLALSSIGTSHLLAGAATIKPYAIAYQSPDIVSRAGGAQLSRPIIFLGDSSVALPPWAQQGMPTIPVLLEEALYTRHPGSSNTRVINWSFPGARLFHYYCLLFEAERYDPSLIIIPINWRSLGPLEDEWNGAFAYPELSSLVPAEEQSHASVAMLMRSEGISPLRQALYAFHGPMLYVTGIKTVLRSAVLSASASSQLLVLHTLPPGEHLIERYGDEALFRQYSATLSQDGPSIEALRLIVETAVRRAITVCFYITPIHLEEMRSRASFDSVDFEASVEGVVAAATSARTACVDLSGLLQEDLFADNYEHYTPEGNRTVASALVPVVQKLLVPSSLRAPLILAQSSKGAPL